jgi:hypothetical protein
MSTTEPGITDLVTRINAAARLIGCDVKAEAFTLDRTWGDQEGIVLLGSAEGQARATAFARRYFDKHLAARRCVDAQWAFGGAQTICVFRDTQEGSATHGRLFRETESKYRAKHPEAFDTTAIALCYYPCAD